MGQESPDEIPKYVSPNAPIRQLATATGAV